MPIVRHIKGGSVSFMDAGRRIVAGPGYTGPLPQRILDRYQRQGRFQVLDEPFPRVTTDVKRDEALTREAAKAEPAREVKLGKFLARHRGKGLWGITETESGKLVSELMPRAEAEAKAKEMNGV